MTPEREAELRKVGTGNGRAVTFGDIHALLTELDLQRQALELAKAAAEWCRDEEANDHEAWRAISAMDTAIEALGRETLTG